MPADADQAIARVPAAAQEQAQGAQRRPWHEFLPRFPREHGAWAMLATALVAGFAGARTIRPVPAFLLGMAAVLAFFSQDALRRSVRPDAKLADLIGGLALGAFACAAGGALLFYCKPWDLLLLSAAGALFFLVEIAFASRYGALGVRQPVLAQILGVAALALAVPGAFLASEGALRPGALLGGGACAAFFISSVFYVGFLMECRHPERLAFARARRAALVYHGALFIGLAALLAGRPAAEATAWLLAFLPALVRALHDLLSPPHTTPPLRRVGMREGIYALWFAIFLPIALR